MILTIPIDAPLQVTPEYLCRLTDCAHKKGQIDWLLKNGWKFVLGASGEPKVGWLYATLKLAGQELGGVSINAGLPDSSLRAAFDGLAPLDWLHKNIKRFLFTREQIVNQSTQFELSSAPGCSGIYFPISDGEIKYIGMARSINIRLKAHCKSGKRPEQFFHIAIDELLMRDLESLYINEFKPDWNADYPPAQLSEYAHLLNVNNDHKK